MSRRGATLTLLRRQKAEKNTAHEECKNMGEKTERKRKLPDPYTFYGSTVYVRSIHRPDGTIRHLEVSKRDKSSELGKYDYGKILLTRRYAISETVRIKDDSSDAGHIIREKLDDVLPNQFFPDFFDNYRDCLSNDLQLAVVLPYAWQKIKVAQKYTNASLDDKEPAIKIMLKYFGGNPIHELSPKYVAPILNDIAQISKKTAKQCNIIFHLLFETVLQNVDKEIATDWRSFHFRVPRGSYLPTYQVRKRLLAPILNEAQCSEIIRRCTKGMETKEAPRFFAAALMLIEGVSLKEICALRLDCFRNMKCYTGCYLQIREEVVLQGEKQKKRDERTRKPRYSIKEPENYYQCRNLGVGVRLEEMLDVLKKRNTDPNALLLSRKSNAKRLLHPEDFESWLEEKFRDVIGKPEIYSDKIVEDTAYVSDYLWNTALHMYRSNGMENEELLHHFGLPPKRTDGVYYADFNAESALVKAARIQDLWLANILPHPNECSLEKGSEILGRACGQPHQIPYLKLTIEIPPGTQLDNDLVVMLSGQFGFSASIVSDAMEND